MSLWGSVKNIHLIAAATRRRVDSWQSRVWWRYRRNQTTAAVGPQQGRKAFMIRTIRPL